MNAYVTLLNCPRTRLVGRGGLLLFVLFCAFQTALPQNNRKAKTLKGFTLVRQVLLVGAGMAINSLHIPTGVWK
jgi:hypothetical protein